MSSTGLEDMEVLFWRGIFLDKVCVPTFEWVWVKITTTRNWTAGFGPWLHLPGFHLRPIVHPQPFSFPCWFQLAFFTPGFFCFSGGFSTFKSFHPFLDGQKALHNPVATYALAESPRPQVSGDVDTACPFPQDFGEIMPFHLGIGTWFS